MSRDATLCPDAELLAGAVIYKVAYGHPGVALAVEVPNMYWWILTFP